MASGLEADIYFAHHYSSWERGVFEIGKTKEIYTRADHKHPEATAMTNRAIINRFMRFAILGLIPTAAYYFFAVLFVETGILVPAYSLPLGFIAAVYISYQLNKKFTWKPETPSSRHFQLYLLISILGALTNYLAYALVVQLLEQSYIYAVLAVTVIIPVQNFALNEKFNFK